MPTDYAQSLEQAQRALIAAQRQVSEEIALYPTPISGCDAQFNHLLAERQRIGAALSALARPAFIATPRTLYPQAGIESR